MTQPYLPVAEAFMIATSRAVDLDMTPRWRWRRRQQLRAELAALCAIADATRDTAVPGSAGSLPLRAIIRHTSGI